VPGFPGISPPAHPYHQFSGKVQPQAKEAYAGGEDLPNREACLRLVNAWEVEHSEEWLRGRRTTWTWRSSASIDAPESGRRLRRPMYPRSGCPKSRRSKRPHTKKGGAPT
jgi:hypothetical protein